MHDSITLSQQTLTYLLTGDLDDACRAIALHTQGVKLSDWLRAHHPTNIESIRRCRLLLEASPEILSNFDAMADVSPTWAAIVTAWSKICILMDGECPNWRRTLWDDGAWQGQGASTTLQSALLQQGCNMPKPHK